MARPVKIAVVQMDAAPAPVGERLEKVENFVARCAQEGARLVVLPEVFNTGYEYSDRNYLQAETFDGETATWMRETAARYALHLAGSFLRRERGEIFNTLLLAAPDRRQWHYDKNYPWMWERAYFRPGTGITVADTALGKIGFLVCWDVAHPGLWRQYAGKVELMVVCSCPPRALEMALVLPDGRRILGQDTGPLVRYLKRTSDPTFGEFLRRQARFLGVPLVQATSTGKFRSPLPDSRASVAMLSMTYPPLWRQRAHFGRICMESGYFNETYLADAAGSVLQAVPPGTEGIAVGEVSLPDSPPVPQGTPPPYGVSAFAYGFDALANRWLAAEYRKKVGKHLLDLEKAPLQGR